MATQEVAQGPSQVIAAGAKPPVQEKRHLQGKGSIGGGAEPLTSPPLLPAAIFQPPQMQGDAPCLPGERENCIAQHFKDNLPIIWGHRGLSRAWEGSMGRGWEPAALQRSPDILACRVSGSVVQPWASVGTEELERTGRRQPEWLKGWKKLGHLHARGSSQRSWPGSWISARGIK